MRDFKASYLLILFIASLFVGSVGVLSYSKYTESRIRGKNTSISSYTLKQMSDFKSLLFQALSSQRRFLVTDDQRHLEEFNQAKNKASTLITEIISGASSPAQRDLAGAIQQNFLALTDNIQLQKSSELSSDNVFRTEALILSGIDKFVADENVVFDRRLGKLVSLNRNFFVTIIVGSFAVFLMMIAMNYYLLIVRRRSDALQKNFKEFKEKQAQSLQATKDGIFEWRLQEQEMYWSPRLKEMIGYEDSDLKASSDMLEQLMHPEDREIYWQDLHKHLRGEIAEHSAFFRWKHKKGHWIWINSRGRAVFNDFGEPVKLIGVHTDVTKLKEYELQLASSKDEAEKANSAKSDFLAHMSHEIRTPLTAITGVAEILTMQSDRFDEKTKKLLDALNTSAISLKDLISDILDFSKIESGKIVLEQKDIPLEEFFDQLISIFSIKAQDKNLEVEWDLHAIAGLDIIGDKGRLRQILVNLIGNAVKFTNSGVVKIEALTMSSDNEEILQVRISDTGVGIREEHLPYIFDSFRQADASISRKYGGTGLGLPIARHLAKLMGGDIYASSRLDEGSVFTLNIPFRKPNLHLPEQKKQEDEEKLTLHLEEGEKILIVEDYEGNIAFITHIMDEIGVRYDLARTGLEGLKLWSGNPYRLILMDIQMPEMDGISAVKHIRTIEKEREIKRPIPIIAMTAHAFAEDRDKCISAGFDDYLAKPLSKHALFEKMCQLIR